MCNPKGRFCLVYKQYTPQISSASLTIASQVIGFLFFTVTLLTLLGGTWNSIMTLFSAPKEARDYLDNLRQEMHELREELRKATKRQRPGSSSDATSSRTSLKSSALRVLNDTMKHLQRDFKRVKGPFLITAPGEDGDLDSPWMLYASRVNSSNMDLSHRICCLRSKGGIVDTAQRLSRILIRKIAY